MALTWVSVLLRVAPASMCAANALAVTPSVSARLDQVRRKGPILRRLLTNPWSMFLLRLLAIFRARLSSSIQKLFDLCVPARAQDLDSRIHTFTTGAYVRGGFHRLRCNLMNFSLDRHAAHHPAAVCIP